MQPPHGFTIFDVIISYDACEPFTAAAWLLYCNLTKWPIVWTFYITLRLLSLGKDRKLFRINCDCERLLITATDGDLKFMSCLHIWHCVSINPSLDEQYKLPFIKIDAQQWQQYLGSESTLLHELLHIQNDSFTTCSSYSTIPKSFKKMFTIICFQFITNECNSSWFNMKNIMHIK